MKKIHYFCDKCQNMIATQRLSIGAVEEKHLLPVGRHEWCINCVDEFDRSLTQTPNINDIGYEHGKK